MKIRFSSRQARETEAELVRIIESLQTTAERLHKVAYSVPMPDTRGRLQGYADMVMAVGGSIIEQFEFYE